MMVLEGRGLWEVTDLEVGMEAVPSWEGHFL